MVHEQLKTAVQFEIYPIGNEPWNDDLTYSTVILKQ